MTSAEKNTGTLLPIPTDFPVEWESEEEDTYLWRWDSIHSPLPASPMATSIGEDRAARQAKQNPSSSNARSNSIRRRINGYSYSANLPSDTSEEDRQKSQAEMDESIRTVRHRWDTEIRPTMEAELGHAKSIDLASLNDAELLEHLDEFLDSTVRHWRFHNEVVGPTHTAVYRLAEFYKAIMGDVPEDEPYRLIRGLENKSLETDQAIQNLATQARESAKLSDLFANHNPHDILSSLNSSDEGRRFHEKLDEFLSVYGLRPTGFDVLFPSWIEDPSFVVMNIKSFIQSPPKDVPAEQKVLSGEAAACRRKVLGKIGDDNERAEEFLLHLKHARGLWPLKEDHAFYIDQGSAACVRIFLVEVGRRLADQGVVTESVNVFYLTLDEALTALRNESSGSLNHLVSERRSLRDSQVGVVPPAFLGTLPADGSLGMAPEFQTMMGPAPDLSAEQGQPALRGIGGASGVFTGPAKIVRSPEEFGKIRPGDILVCTSTSPTWTPLFGTVGALVSDSGGVLSHTAIVAREYGLPAVVGVHNGTDRITDGQVITVDGDNGVVLLR